ncbi:MAG: HAD family hydrolase [Lachnospiraceae bacterium]|nr:HAD family hydrolase [Lachnospiraceae bacterium]
MRFKTVLFDLDGTLLPMDQDVFMKAYFKGISGKAAPFGYDPASLVQNIWKGTYAMVKNDGSASNEDVFWNVFNGFYDFPVDKDIFNRFYENEFDEVRLSCGFTPDAAALVRRLKDAGCGVILASNPLFPMTAQQHRMMWAGLDPSDFDYITSYENSRYCKPNPDYYREIASKCGLNPAECLMVGNDAGEDLPAAKAGFHVFLLTDCLINKQGTDCDALPHGGFPELSRFLSGTDAGTP